MIKRSFFLLSTTALLFGSANVSIASGSFPNTHTQHTPKLKPASLDLDNSFQIASVCFLGGNCGNDGGFNKGGDDYQIDTKQQCKNEGFTKTSCSLPSYLDVQCPYNSAYYAKCTEDKPRACKEGGFNSLSCSEGQVTDVVCPYESNYKKCKCNPCSGYVYTYAQATAQGYVPDGSCKSCNETKYKRKENPCSGYVTCECGGATGASVCYTGTAQKFNSCKPCCNEACPAGTSESNPGGCGGSTQNECKTKTCYYPYQSCCDNSCAGDTPGCPPYYREWTSQDGCGNICYNCSCDPAFCVSKCTPGKNVSGQPGVTLALKIKFCDESNFRDYENKWEFASSGGYCSNLDGGRHMYISTNWGMTYVTWCP